VRGRFACSVVRDDDRGGTSGRPRRAWIRGIIFAPRSRRDARPVPSHPTPSVAPVSEASQLDVLCPAPAQALPAAAVARLPRGELWHPRARRRPVLAPDRRVPRRLPARADAPRLLQRPQGLDPRTTRRNMATHQHLDQHATYAFAAWLRRHPRRRARRRLRRALALGGPLLWLPLRDAMAPAHQLQAHAVVVGGGLQVVAAGRHGRPDARSGHEQASGEPVRLVLDLLGEVASAEGAEGRDGLVT
jgi:hypothetical protein